MDLSEEMLRAAQDKARRAGEPVRFIRQDMRALELHRPVDAVISICDGVNYLLTDADLDAFFASAARNLRPGGVLAFDISTREKLGAMDGQVYFEDGNDITWMWRNALSGDTLVMDLTFFERRPGGMYARHDERHTQRLHDPEKLIKMMKKAGFADIVTVSKDGIKGALADPERLYFSAVKAGQPKADMNR